MKKNPIKRSLPALLLAAVMLLSAVPCSLAEEAPLAGEILVDFANGADPTGNVFPSDGWSNESVFNTFWKADCLSYADGQMHLAITPSNGEVAQGYYAGEARTDLYYGYGDYSVSMKAAKAEGAVCSFFTCTGNYDVDVNGNPNPWDEIDIEILGKDTTKVQFNYYVNGQGGHEYFYDLGFDASEDFHEYGFRWAEDAITWFVDGEAVYSVNAADNGELPVTPGRILMNYWCGTPEAEEWLGVYTPSEVTADYQWVKTSAQGAEFERQE